MGSRLRLIIAGLQAMGIAGALVLIVLGCDSSVDSIKSAQSGSGFISGSNKNDKNLSENGDSLFSESQKKKDGELFDGEGSPDEDGEGSGDANIVFPELEFRAQGFATCDGDTRPATAGVVTMINEDVLDINMHTSRVDAGRKGQKKADAEMAKSRGHTYYNRSPKSKLNELKADGFDYTRFAIFADGVDKSAQQHEFFFDKPLPVYPWPGPESRYTDLDDGPMSWTSNVTGHRSFRATIKITKISSSSRAVELKFELSIAEDTNRSLYEDFPIPREAIYTINPETKDVRKIYSTNWHYGDENCKSNAEEVKLTYKLCKKTTGDKVDNIPCA